MKLVRNVLSEKIHQLVLRSPDNKEFLDMCTHVLHSKNIIIEEELSISDYGTLLVSSIPFRAFDNEDHSVLLYVYRNTSEIKKSRNDGKYK